MNPELKTVIDELMAICDRHESHIESIHKSGMKTDPNLERKVMVDIGLLRQLRDLSKNV